MRIFYFLFKYDENEAALLISGNLWNNTGRIFPAGLLLFQNYLSVIGHNQDHVACFQDFNDLLLQ